MLKEAVRKVCVQKIDQRILETTLERCGRLMEPQQAIASMRRNGAFLDMTEHLLAYRATQLFKTQPILLTISNIFIPQIMHT